MKVSDITALIEEKAPLYLQEDYDNSGLIIGKPDMQLTGALICIDVTENVLDEAIKYKLNLIISHHPLIFKGLKKINGKNEVERCVEKAIKNDIAVYAAHTNIDNILEGVNGKIAEKLGLKSIKILSPKTNSLLKLATYVPIKDAEKVRMAMFNAGAGNIGNYEECSYNVDGYGTFKPMENAQPFTGEIGKQEITEETRVEVILPKYILIKTLEAMLEAHPYEEAAYDVLPLVNNWNTMGAGILGELDKSVSEEDFLQELKKTFDIKMLKHTALRNKMIKKVAVCGGSGSEFLNHAIAAKADVFISADFKYHNYFDAENKILIADIGHFESEQFTKEIFYEIIRKKMPKFAVRISKVKTNPINYL